MDRLTVEELLQAARVLVAERRLDQALPAGRVTLAVGAIARRVWPQEQAPLVSVGSPLYGQLVRRIQELCQQTEALTYVHND